MPDFFHQWRRERDSHSRWGEPSRRAVRKDLPGKFLVYPDSLHNISKWYARPVTLRTRHSSSATSLIRRTVLFELRAHVAA